mgnify:CR=1 FL=1
MASRESGARHPLVRRETRRRGTPLGGVACAALLASGTAFAADHRDSPSQLLNPQADINDIYAFMNPNDPEELVLVMTVVQNAASEDESISTFSNTINYDFLIESSAGTTVVDNLRLRCVFPSETRISCSLGDTTATGTVGDMTQTLPENGMRVYAGLREDPFFFNGPGLNMTLPEEDEFATMSPGLMFQAAAAENDGEADAFAGENTLAMVIGIDRDLLTANQAAPVLKIWAATSPR